MQCKKKFWKYSNQIFCSSSRLYSGMFIPHDINGKQAPQRKEMKDIPISLFNIYSLSLSSCSRESLLHFKSSQILQNLIST